MLYGTVWGKLAARVPVSEVRGALKPKRTSQGFRVKGFRFRV